jgi:hypothetical protein
LFLFCQSKNKKKTYNVSAVTPRPTNKMNSQTALNKIRVKIEINQKKTSIKAKLPLV